MPKKDKATKLAAKAEKKAAKEDTSRVADGEQEETFFVRTGKTAAHRANLNMVRPP
jgi:hypothetical protein